MASIYLNAKIMQLIFKGKLHSRAALIQENTVSTIINLLWSISPKWYKILEKCDGPSNEYWGEIKFSDGIQYIFRPDTFS